MNKIVKQKLYIFILYQIIQSLKSNCNSTKQNRCASDKIRANQWDGINYYSTYHPANPNGWKTTLAPGSTIPNLVSNYERHIYPKVITGTPDQNTANGYFINVPGTLSTCFPYLPGWSLQQRLDNGFWVNAISSGTDCLGLVQMSASYTNYGGNNYEWEDLTIRHYPGTISTWDTEEHGIGKRVFPTTDRGLSWKVIQKTDRYQTIVNGQLIWLYPGLEKVIPGDVIYYLGNPGHIMIVQSIEYDVNNRTTSTARIRVIEATYGVNENSSISAKVININTLNFYNIDNWIIVRLKIN